MPRHNLVYDKNLKSTPEWGELYNKWIWMRKSGSQYSVAFAQFMDFYNWSMANGYAIDARLKRLDEKKPYAPDNCLWVHPEEERSGYTAEQKAWIAKWNKTVNRIRRHFGIETFDYEGDA